MYNFIRKRMRSPLQLLGWLAAGLALSLSSLASAEVLRRAVAAIENADPARLQSVIGLAVAATLWTILFEYLKRISERKLQNRYETKLQSELFAHTLRLRKLNFLEKRAGEILTLLQTNVESAVGGVLYTLEEAVYGAGVLLFSLCYMGSLNLQLTAVVIVCNILFRVCTRFFDKKIRAFSKRVISYVGESNSFFMEVLRNELPLRVYRREEAFEELFEKKEKAAARAGLSVFALRNGYDEITWFTLKLIELVVIYGVGGMLILKGQFPFSVLTAFTMASDSFMKGMNAVISAVNEYNSALPHIEAVEKELDISCEEEDEAAQPPVSGDIVFQDVSFSFPGRKIFEKVSFTIHTGDRVLVTGANGRGKSTLFGLLLGFYRPQEGRITIGGKDTAEYSTDALCQMFGYIPQEPHIFSGSVEENLSLALSEDRGKTGNILDELHISHIRDLDPLRCSMGERQRLGIGRAFYQGEGRPALLGDEIFANVDAGSREAILRALESFSVGRTVFLICHGDTGYPFTHRLHLGETEVSYTPIGGVESGREVRA